MPWMNAPSTCPMSIAGLMESPASCRRSARKQLPLAGQRVDDHFRHRGAVGEIEERPAAHGARVPVQLGRGVEAVGPQLDPRAIGLHARARGTRSPCRRPTPCRRRRRRPRRGRRTVRGECARRSRDLPRGILRRLAVEIAAGGRGGGRRIRDLARVGGGRAHVREADAELVRDDLRDLGIEPLPHLGPAMAHEHRAVGVHVDQRAGLVVMHDIERDPELDRRQRDAFFQYRARCVERAGRAAALADNPLTLRARRRARGSRCPRRSCRTA